MEITYKHSLKEIVKNNIAHINFVQDAIVYYEIPVKDIMYTIPVPINDMGTGAFRNTEKAILLMRWIRKAMESQTMKATPGLYS